MDFLEGYKYKKCEFPDLDYEQEKIMYGKLKMLEDLAIYIDTMRESLDGDTEEEENIII